MTGESMLKASTAMHPLGRIGEPADVASAIDWLLDPKNSWVTGQVLGVDGGLAALGHQVVRLVRSEADIEKGTVHWNPRSHQGQTQTGGFTVMSSSRTG